MRAPLALLFALLLSLALAGCDCGAMVLDTGDGGDGTVGEPDAADEYDGGISTDAGDEGDGGQPSDGGDADAGGSDGGVLPDGGSPDGGCPPVSCAGLCGPVRDFCTGQVLQCGTCLGGLVCNLVSHVCLQPAIDCAALGATCGQVKNSCGKRLNCGACTNPAQECDRNTHRCVPCSGATCADLGYQCGDVWLGCGPFANTTHCGDCAVGAVCNSALHICEPACSPGSDLSVCQAAGAECGFITNGCGGLANCGSTCPAGTSCGARGVGNRCDPPELPDECVAANRNCGPLTSACGGPALNCGTCTAPDICWADGNCRPPCVSRTCAAPELANKCGTGLDAGCARSINCTCAGGLVCNAAGAGVEGDCVTAAGCTAFGATGASGAPCSNGKSPEFPKGDGTNLTCPCVGGGVCVSGGAVVSGPDAGTCCVNTIACAANACGTSVTDACTGASIACNCTAANTHCNTTAKVCEADHTCATYGANGLSTNPCSIGAAPAFPKNNTVNLACPCNGGGRCNLIGSSTTQAAPNTKGECCFNTAVCAANECNSTKVNTCTGATVTCACTATGTHCNNVTKLCEANNGCSLFTNGQAGSDCSNGASTAFPKGDGTNLTCPCTAPGALCFNGTTPLPVGSPIKGLCCVPDVCPAGTCGSIVNHCTGATINCTCGGGTHCSGTTCIPNLTCGSYSANGAQGDTCSNGPSFSNGATPPTLLTCACAAGPLVCSNGTTEVSGATQGTCCLNTTTCGNTCNTTATNSCTGAVTTCNCSGATYCNGTPGVCVPYLTCADQTPPADGADGAPCSTSVNPAFARFPGDGTGLTCGCTGGRECALAAPTPHLAGAGEVGACCTNVNPTCGNSCNTSVTDSCTGVVTVCNCGAGNWCNGTPGVCVPYASCANQTPPATGANGDPCSTSANTSFPRYPGDGTGQTCGCGGSRVCSVAGAPPHTAGAGEVGSCCTNSTFCGTSCGLPLTNSCTGAPITCNCGGGNYCKANTCSPYETCGSYTTGGAGQPCSNGANAVFPKGDGSNLACGCSAGGVCVSGGGPVPPGGTGTCCFNTAVCPANTCASITNTCTGATIACSCNAGSHCNSATVCAVNKTCADYSANGAVGNACSAGPTSAFHDGPNNTNLTCNCSTAAPNSNNTCTGWNATTAGTCTCTPTVPANCSQNGLPNGCGGTMSFACTPGTQVCYANACCTKTVCGTGAAGTACGAITKCGLTTTCNCTGYNTCGGGGTAGVCGCTPKTLADCGVGLPAGQTSPDGCGGTVTCPG